MTGARGHFRRSVGALCAAAPLALAAGNPGCSRAEETPGRTSTRAAAGTGGAPAASSADGGGGGGGGGGGASYAVAAVVPARAFDATPDPGAAHVYFTAIDASGRAGVFKASARGEARAVEVAVGPPFVAPLGIATSTDGGRLFVADPGAGSAADRDAGHVFAIDPTGGAVAPVQGGEGLVARALEVVRAADGEDRILVSGRDPADGQPGVFSLPARGGDVAVIARGSPLADPSGVAAAGAGDRDVFVCDPLASPDGTATIFRIEDGFVSPFATGLHAGYPCGLALTRDGAALFVLTRDVARGADEIVRIDVASGARSSIEIGARGHDEPGGLHRAKGADVFAFVDHRAQETGSVFLLRP
ncbi:uncharacterized protein SOCEGT47_064900 [Sorangium cellulosum]|uniref:Uncharacterized protein n=1 Tax=Sorangium cellulosum TaxID=56 RepID=A0A4P2Q8M0_SORCE|nr:hypothetical protein [Sorangium cellulosum]AUX25937.1 uncharacterized protein SOCEGT47_064900 [Sorangium cellulosum]